MKFDYELTQVAACDGTLEAESLEDARQMIQEVSSDFDWDYDEVQIDYLKESRRQ